MTNVVREVSRSLVSAIREFNIGEENQTLNAAKVWGRRGTEGPGLLAIQLSSPLPGINNVHWPSKYQRRK